MMETVEDIIEAVKHFPGSDLMRFRAWFAQFDADAWDAQIEADAWAGKLDQLTKVALAEYAARGRRGSR